MHARNKVFSRALELELIRGGARERERESLVCVCYTDYRYRREKFNMRVEAIIRAMGLDESLEVDQLPGEAISIRKMAEGGAEVEE